MKKILLIIFGFLLLVGGLFFGVPFEFLNQNDSRIATIIIGLFVIALFIFLFSLVRKIDDKKIKIGFYVLFGILTLPYIIIGIGATFFCFSYYPMWEDTAIYTNANGEKIITQWRETSGSIYDYRTRRIFIDRGEYRVSINWSMDNLHGRWTVHKIEKDSIYIVDFDKK